MKTALRVALTRTSARNTKTRRNADNGENPTDVGFYISVESQPALAVHTNFYIANGVLPVPVYGDVNEEENLVVIARLASIGAISSYDKTKDDGPMGLV